MLPRDLVNAKHQASERDEIEDVIEDKYINDYGTIVQMHGQTSCDVQHAVQRSKPDGTWWDQTITKNVEIIWPTSALLSVRWDLANGDRVRLVGFKHYIKSLGSNPMPIQQQVYNAYNQETLKAIPCGVFNEDAGIKIVATGGNLTIDMGSAGTFAIKNAAGTLKSVLDSLMDYLNALSANPAVPGSPVWPPGAVNFAALKASLDAIIGA